jgi:trimeric autotransporter adhesin
VYAPRLNHRDERLLDGCQLPALCSRPALLVVDAFHALQPAGPERARRDAQLVDACLSVLRADGSVLIPTDSSGRALELLAALDAAWGERRLAGAYGLAFVSPVAASTVEFSKCLVEYASESVRRAFERDRVNQLKPRHAKLVASPDALAAAIMAATDGGSGGGGSSDAGKKGGARRPGAAASAAPTAAAGRQRPMVVLASGGAGLEAGPARELFLSRWAADPRSAVLLASRPPDGSLGARLLAERAAPAGSRLKPPLPCRVRVWEREELAGEELAEHERARDRRRAERLAVRGGGGAMAEEKKAKAAGLDEAGADAAAAAAAAAAVADAAAAAAMAPGGPHFPSAAAAAGASASASAATAALIDGFEPPAEAAHAMFPDDDEVLCAPWDAYGEVLDMDALRRAAEQAGADGPGGLGGGSGGPGAEGAGALGVGDGRRPGGGRPPMSAAAQALARMAAIIGADGDDQDDDDEDDDSEAEEEESSSDGGEREEDEEQAAEEEEEAGGRAAGRPRKGRGTAGAAAAAGRKPRRRAASGGGAAAAAAATVAAATAAAAAAAAAAAGASSSSSSEDEGEGEGKDGKSAAAAKAARRAKSCPRQAPTKAVLREINVPVAVRVLPYVDYDGASDGRSLSAVAAQCSARCLAVAGGSRDGSAALAYAVLAEGRARGGGGRVVVPCPGESVDLVLAPAFRVRVGPGVVAKGVGAADEEQGVGTGEDDDANNAGARGGKLHAIGGYSLAWISGTLKALQVDGDQQQQPAADGDARSDDEGGGGRARVKKEGGGGAAATEDAAMAEADDSAAAAAGVKQEQQEEQAAPLGLASAEPLLPWPQPRLALAAGAPPLPPAAAQAAAAAGEGSVFIGDVRLSELRQALAAAGVAAEFRAAAGGAAAAGGGVLACAGGVRVRRDRAGGELLVEGPLCDEYFRVREVLYASYGIV